MALWQNPWYLVISNIAALLFLFAAGLLILRTLSDHYRSILFHSKWKIFFILHAGLFLVCLILMVSSIGVYLRKATTKDPYFYWEMFVPMFINFLGFGLWYKIIRIKFRKVSSSEISHSKIKSVLKIISLIIILVLVILLTCYNYSYIKMVQAFLFGGIYTVIIFIFFLSLFAGVLFSSLKNK